MASCQGRRNLADHKVSFEAARLALDEPNALDEFLPDDSGYEDRFRKLVLGGVGLLVVIYTEREGGRRTAPSARHRQLKMPSITSIGVRIATTPLNKVLE